MRICVLGAGAGGGHLAVRLAKAGHEVCVIARGDHLQAIRSHGLRLRIGADVLTADLPASDDPRGFGAQDLVIVAVKATGLAAAAELLPPLVGPETLALFPQNGMAWWYPHGLPADRPRPPAVPVFALGERFLTIVPLERVLGGVIYSANVVEAPGVVANRSPKDNRLVVAAIDGRETTAVAEIRRVLEGAGIGSRPLQDLRDALWRKLIVNITGSTIAFVTASTSGACREHAGLREVFHRAVGESRAVAAAHGYPLPGLIGSQAMLDRLLDHRPSMLQDYELNRPMEVGEILLAPLTFARAVGLATPTLDTLAAIASRLASARGLFDLAPWDKVVPWGTPTQPAAAAQ